MFKASEVVAGIRKAPSGTSSSSKRLMGHFTHLAKPLNSVRTPSRGYVEGAVAEWGPGPPSKVDQWHSLPQQARREFSRDSRLRRHTPTPLPAQRKQQRTHARKLFARLARWSAYRSCIAEPFLDILQPGQ